MTGSLAPLGNLSKLKTLDINNTNLDSGLEYLPESLEKFYCDRTKLIAELEPCGKPDVYNFLSLLRDWKQAQFVRQQNIEQIVKIRVVPKNK